MSLLQALRIGFQYSLQDALFTDVSFDINPGDRIALAGPNGCGKSTLLRILSGELAADHGQITRRRALQTATLPQVPQPEPGATLRLWSEDPLLPDLERILRGLGFVTAQFDIEIRHLSAGQRTTAYLARCLASSADLLLLDEPTNHLDVRARRWLSRELAALPAACELVSHDRRFLERFATRVFHFHRGKVDQYTGTYSEFESQHAVRLQAQWSTYEHQQQQRAAWERASAKRSALSRAVAQPPRGQSVNMVSSPFYKAKAARVARTARILRERSFEQPEVAKPWEDEPIAQLTFDQVRRSGDPPVDCLAVSKSYGDRLVLDQLTFQCRRGERWALRGPNGSGKTTLFRLILGREHPDGGEIRIAQNVQFGYYAQEADDLDPTKTAAEIAGEFCSDRQRVRTLLACLKLPRVLADQPVGLLSPGERAKAAVARVVLSGANVLLLDEPTNHLEMEAQDALAATLNQFPGTLILVTHDESFAEGCGCQFLDLQPR